MLKITKDYAKAHLERLRKKKQRLEKENKDLKDEVMDLYRRFPDLINKDDLLLFEVIVSKAGGTKALLATIISWEKDLGEYESLEAKLMRMFEITVRK